MYREPSTEDVAHDDDVSFRVVDRDSVHSEILRQQRVCMPLDNVLHNTATSHYHTTLQRAPPQIYK